MSVGRCGARALMTLPEAARVATASSVGLEDGQVGVPARGQLVGSRRRPTTAARAASAARHAAKRSLHSACAAAPRFAAAA